MNKMKKILCGVMSALLVAGTAVPMASCGKNGGNVVTGDVDVVAYDGSEQTITFYHTMGKNLREVLNTWIPEFNKMYPNIKVEHESLGGYPDLRDQISTELTSKRAPSLAFCYADHVALYNNSKAVLTLDDYMVSDLTVERADGRTETVGYTDEQLADLVPSYLNEGRVFGDGKTYALPYAKSTEVLYYNKTYFDEKGYEVPTTWEEMETLCATIKTAEPNNIPLGYDSEANWFITMAEQKGAPYTSATPGQKFLFNNEQNWESVEMMKRWYEKGYVTTEEIYTSYTSELFTELDPDKTKTYMTIGSSAGASYQTPSVGEGEQKTYGFEVGVAPIPQVDPSNPKAISQGPSLCIFKKSNNQEVAAAWLFAKWMTTYVPLQANYSSQSGYAPVIKSVEQNPVYAEFLETANGYDNVQASCVKMNIAIKDSTFTSPAFNGSSEARDEVGLLVVKILTTPKAQEDVRDFIKKCMKDSIENELEFFFGA